jgi:YVTN family beta-propeller protein
VVNSNNTVSAINTATDKVIGTWSAGASPSGLAVTPDGTQLYATSSTAVGAVTILNASTGAVIKTIAVDGNPGFLQISPDGGSAYVPSDLPGTVTVIDTASQTIKTKIPIGINADSVAFTPSGSLAYVTDPRGKEVAVIDTTTLTVTHVLRLHAATQYVAVNPADAQDVFVLDGADATGLPQEITVIKGDKVIKTLTIRDAHIGFFALTPNGKYAYVPNTYHGGAPYNYVGLVNTTTYKKVGKMIRVGNKPVGVAIAHNGAYAYVTNYQDNTVSVIQISPAQ